MAETDGPLEDGVHWLEKHPAIAVGGVIVLGLGAYLLFFAPSGGTAATANGGVDAAALQYQESVNATQAQSNAQTSNQNFQLAAQAGGYSGQLALAQESDKTALLAQNTASQVATLENQNQTNIDLSGIAAQLTALENTNQTTQNVAQISANENTSIAGINANVAINQSNNLTTLGVTQANDWTKVQTTISNNATTSSIFGGALGFLGALL